MYFKDNFNRILIKIALFCAVKFLTIKTHTMADTNFYALKVKNVDAETEHAVVLTFDVPEDLQNNFQYKQPSVSVGLRLHVRRTTLRMTKKINTDTLS